MNDKIKILDCKCGRIHVGTKADSTARNWNPDCPTHGLTSVWWNSMEQIEKRAADNARLRDLQQQAREARKNYPDEIVALLHLHGLNPEDVDILLDTLDGNETTDVERAWVKRMRRGGATPEA